MVEGKKIGLESTNDGRKETILIHTISNASSRVPNEYFRFPLIVPKRYIVD